MALQTALKGEVAMYRAATYAESTKKTYRSQLNSYLKFCESVNVVPVPASGDIVAQYAAFLARRLAPSSVKQYLNVVRLLHMESNFPNPCEDNWILKTTLTGIDRLLGTPTVRKTPVTPSLLLQLHSQLDMRLPLHAMFWAAALVMFFGTFRKSNLFPDKSHQFCSDKQFTRKDFVVCPDGTVLIHVKYSKTIQFKQRSYVVKLFKFNHILCPVSAINAAFLLCELDCSSPAFVQDGSGLPMDGVTFNKLFKESVKRCGKDAKNYSSHSFRRGSATWALQCGVPGEVVQQMGDWKSSCYRLYLDQLPQQVHDHYRQLFISKLPAC